MANYTLQFASDLHLNQESAPFDQLLRPVAADLALCGDIGDPWSSIYGEFLAWCSARWTRVFLIAGNHEYFVEDPSKWGSADKTFTGTENEIRRIAGRHRNLHFLQESVYLNESLKIAVVGATLWTAPALRQWGSMSSGFIGDPGCRGEYTAVYKRDEFTSGLRVLHPSDITAIHLRQSQFITRYLNKSWGSVPEGYRVIVLTHHLPSLLLNPPEFKNHPLISCYASSLDGLLKEPVVVWICGHSHRGAHLRMDSGCLVALNPLGYKGEVGKTDYRPNATVVVYPENIAIFRSK